jgi:hypothetical protein
LFGEEPCAEEIADHAHPIRAVEAAETFHNDQSAARAFQSIGRGDEDFCEACRTALHFSLSLHGPLGR